MGKIEPCEHPEFNDFVATIAALRAPDGCPWDREQTHASITGNMIEEAYEAVDAIEHNDVAHLREELGDVLLQVVLQSQIAADNGEFTIDDVCREVNEKIVRRHPHVFGDVEGGSANEVIALWDKIKLTEKEAADEGVCEEPPHLLDGVPSGLPALTQAQKISRKAAAVGFDWETPRAVWDKVAEEIDEFKEAYACAPKDDAGKILHASSEANDVEAEFGDVLFSLVNVARKTGIDAERALRATCRKFRERWGSMEDFAYDEARALEDMDMVELESLWQRAKEDARSNEV